MGIGFMWDYQVVEHSGVPEPDEATLNPFGPIGDTLVVVTTVAATGRLLASLTRGTLPGYCQVNWRAIKSLPLCGYLGRC
jgi:hypothetical protein